MAYTGLLKRLPLREILRFYRAIRRSAFTVPWPRAAPSVHSDVNPSEVESRLRFMGNFESGVHMSYRYEGELMNMRRPEGVFYMGDEMIQLQLHIRGRKIGDMEWEYVGHVEPDPDEHPRLHIDEVGFRWDKELTQQVMEEAGIHTW